MVNVPVPHNVADYRKRRAALDAALDFRQDGGEGSCRICRKAGDRNDLTLIFEWEDLATAQRS